MVCLNLFFLRLFGYALTMYVTVHIFDCFVHLDKQTLIDKFGCNVKARVGKINKASDVSEHEH